MNLKLKILLTTALITFSLLAFGQQNEWDKWSWMMGEWAGEGGGQPGQGGGTYSFTFDLDKKIIKRISHSEYPATENKPAVIHDDLMIVYMESGEGPARAIYFDNEGHVINYSITYAEKSIIMTSAVIPNAPVFRLTYTLLENGKVNTRFEFSRDGKDFMTYVEGISQKVQ